MFCPIIEYEITISSHQPSANSHSPLGRRRSHIQLLGKTFAKQMHGASCHQLPHPGIELPAPDMSAQNRRKTPVSQIGYMVIRFVILRSDRASIRRIHSKVKNAPQKKHSFYTKKTKQK
jgi:hypothetical protein